MGQSWGSSVSFPAMVEEGARMVRDEDAREVVSSARVHCDFSLNMPVGSKLTLWVGTVRERESTVISVMGSDHPVIPGYQTLALA